MTLEEIEQYMIENKLSSVILGIHSHSGHFTALRTSRTRSLEPNHGAGDDLATAMRNLMDQDAGRAKPVQETLDLSNAAPASRTTATVQTAPADEDDFEDLIG